MQAAIMTHSHPQDGNDLATAQLDRELEGLISHLAYCRETVLSRLYERMAAFDSLLGTANGDVLWRTDRAVLTGEASHIAACLNSAWASFQCASRDVERPLQLAVRAVRRVLSLPDRNFTYDAVSDIDIEGGELQRRIKQCRRSVFWRRIAYRLFRGQSPQVVDGDLGRAEFAVGLLTDAIDHWTVAYEFLKRHMDETKIYLGKVLAKLQEIFERTRDVNDPASQELAHLEYDFRQILSSIDEIVESFHNVKLALSRITSSVADELDELNKYKMQHVMQPPFTPCSAL